MKRKEGIKSRRLTNNECKKNRLSGIIELDIRICENMNGEYANIKISGRQVKEKNNK